MYTVENKENIDLQKLQDDLEKQYGPAVAQDIVDRIRKTGNAAKAPDYMDVNRKRIESDRRLRSKFRSRDV